MGKLVTQGGKSYEQMSGGTVIGFHDIKLYKVGGRGANPDGRAELHQAVDEGL